MNSFIFCPRCGNKLVDRETDGRVRRACGGEGCNFVHYDNPLPVVAGIVEIEAGVVLVRSQGWPEKMFGLVTGFLERDEASADAIVREVQEELGLISTVEKLVGVYPFTMRNEVIIAYALRATGTIVLGSELADYRVVPKAKLRPWPMGTGFAVADWLGA